MTIVLTGIAIGVLIIGATKYLEYRMKQRERLLNEKLEKHFKDGL